MVVPDVGLQRLRKLTILGQAVPHGLQAAFLGQAGGDEHQAVVDVLPVRQLVRHVAGDAGEQAAPVF